MSSKTDNTKTRKAKAPNINARRYAALVGSIGQLNRVACPYCANDTFTANPGAYWICSHCESAIYGPSVASNRGNAQAVSAINAMMEKGDYKTAAAEYEKIAKTTGGVVYWYRTGLIYFECSNAEISQIRYDRRGFMEENSTHRDNAALATSRAKLMFYKAVRMCEDSFDQGVADPQVAFAYVMLGAKVDNLRYIKKGISVLKIYNVSALVEYASMILGTATKNYDEILLHAANLLTVGMFTVNAFYYMSWALFKKRRPEDALLILHKLSQFVHTPSVNALIKEIESGILL
jgi:ribosomal protein L37AE/L43A